jgi:hypothetical protein
MRNVFLLGLAVVLTTAVVLAQDHQNTNEKTVKETITFSTDTKVGTQILKAGEYRVTCDRETISFRDSDGKTVLKTKCKGAELSAPSDHSELHTLDVGGARVLTKLLLKGSNVEHEFN